MTKCCDIICYGMILCISHRKADKNMAGTTEYKNNWQKEHLDRINLTVPKGYKETIQGHAASQNESVTAFIQRAITETIERDHIFSDRKDEIAKLADKCKIENQDQLKKMVEAFAALKPVIPNIENLYFSHISQAEESHVRVIVSDEMK